MTMRIATTRAGRGLTVVGMAVLWASGCRPTVEPAQPSGGSGSGSADGRSAAEIRCARAHDLPPITMADILAAAATGTDCSTTHCGTNGVWLGKGVPFRELHVREGIANAAGLTITGFRDRQGHALQLDVQRDQLIGIPKGQPGAKPLTTDDELRNAVISISSVSTAGAAQRYELTIARVAAVPFWTRCTGDQAHCDATFSSYEFSAIDLSDQCPVQLCAPGLDDHHPNSIAGTAAIFRGDRYTDQHVVTEAAAGDDIFNLACMGTALSKLHLLRYTSAAHAAQHSPPDPPAPTPAERQTLLRLLTADYCGTGLPFTVDGLPLRLNMANPSYALTQDSGYVYGSPLPAAQVDARWNKNGATCVGTPRAGGTLADIHQLCGAATPPACASQFDFDHPFTPAPPDSNTSGISVNP